MDRGRSEEYILINLTLLDYATWASCAQTMLVVRRGGMFGLQGRTLLLTNFVTSSPRRYLARMRDMYMSLYSFLDPFFCFIVSAMFQTLQTLQTGCPLS
jgi:hypothetical protein